MTLRLALLGDSIAWGQGAAGADERLAPRLVRGLAEGGVGASAEVYAVPGARSAGLRPQVDRALRWDPDLVLVVVGANDLTHRVPVASAAQDLGDAVRRLRERGADVLVAPAPDLGVVPVVPEVARAVVSAGSRLLREAQVVAVREAGGHVADRHGSTSGWFAQDAALFSADGFHPSSAGYAVIADALLPDLLALARARSAPSDRSPR